jgi:hypothetical protein
MKKIKTLALAIILSTTAFSQTQESSTSVTPTAADKIQERFKKEGLKVYLSNDSSQWLKATVVMQAQARYDWNNPGSTVFGYAQNKTADAGLRRLRLQLFGQVSKRVFVYTQFGLNNFNYLAPRKQDAFFHDVVAEYSIWKKHITFGTGLTSFGGPLRYSAPAVGSILMADAPIYQQTTNDQNDQFGRKLGIYFKGQLGKFDYRIAVGKPFSMQTQVPTIGSAAATSIDTSYSSNAKFSPAPPDLQYQGYFKYHFFDTESNDLPYNTGTYLGKKRMLTLGAGIQYQQNAMRYWNGSSVPVAPTATEIATNLKNSNLMIIGVDLFYDSYLNKEKGNAISVYAAYSYADYGQNYLRYNGVMNMATGMNTSVANFNTKAFGNAFPMMGTGNSEFAQIGYKFKNNLLGDRGTLQPYIGTQINQYKALQFNNMVMCDVGVSWLISGYNKISLNYQSRPVYEQDAVTKNYVDVESARRGMLYLQYQIAF